MLNFLDQYPPHFSDGKSMATDLGPGLACLRAEIEKLAAKPKQQPLKDLDPCGVPQDGGLLRLPDVRGDQEISKGTECIVRQWQTPSMPGPAFWYAHLGCADKWEDCPDKFKRDDPKAASMRQHANQPACENSQE